MNGSSMTTLTAKFNFDFNVYINVHISPILSLSNSANSKCSLFKMISYDFVMKLD